MSRLLLILPAVLIAACANADAQRPFAVEAIAEFDEPWAMAFLQDGHLLVTEKAGRLLVVARDGNKSKPVSGVPDVDYGGQGGLGDVALHPDFAENRQVYLSYVEAGEGDTRGAAVARSPRSPGAATTLIGCYSMTKGISLFPRGIARNSIRRRTWVEIWARSSA
jgi:glucose/arabinose dehydrogenase